MVSSVIDYCEFGDYLTHPGNEVDDSSHRLYDEGTFFLYLHPSFVMIRPQ